MSINDKNDKPDIKRKFPRRRFGRQIGCLAEGIYTIGQCVEIGEGGVGIAFKAPLAMNQNIVVNFQIPGGSFVSVRALICSVNPVKQGNLYILGCRFENLHFDRKREIRTYVSTRSESGH